MDSFTVARRFLFALEAERAHNIGLMLMRFAPKTKAEPMPITTALGDLANPLGLAAGYDKTGGHINDLARLGFGYIVAGTFTRSSWPGNPKPRVARNIDEQTLVNSLGFPNPGVDEFVRNLVLHRKPEPPLVASISGRTLEDVTFVYSKVQPYVAGVELNLSSPNTPALQDLREPKAFAELARRMKDAKDKPSYLKIPPYLDDNEFKETMLLVKRWEDMGFEGVTAGNSMPVPDERMAIGTGGYSGPPLIEHTKAAVEKIRKSVDHSFEINAVGGISSPTDAAALLGLGATTIQVFTALVYQGPNLTKKILTDPEVRQVIEARSSPAWSGPTPKATKKPG
jgi:dihydroorotate dehydrogenase